MQDKGEGWVVGWYMQGHVQPCGWSRTGSERCEVACCSQVLLGGGFGLFGGSGEGVGTSGGGGLGVDRRCVDGGGGGVLSTWCVTRCCPAVAEKRLTGLVA